MARRAAQAAVEIVDPAMEGTDQRVAALALLVGLLLGAYSSIYIATPILAVLKEREAKYQPRAGQLSLGADMLKLFGVQRSEVESARPREVSAPRASSVGETTSVASALTHPPRPRKKRRR